MAKKELKCSCCGRPFRKPNLPLYNFPEGATCLDCADRVTRFYNVDSGYIGFHKYVSQFKTMNKRDNKITIEIAYNRNNLRPFDVGVHGEKWGQVLSFASLDDLREMRDKLSEFIENCEI